MKCFTAVTVKCEFHGYAQLLTEEQRVDLVILGTWRAQALTEQRFMIRV